MYAKRIAILKGKGESITEHLKRKGKCFKMF